MFITFFGRLFYDNKRGDEKFRFDFNEFNSKDDKGNRKNNVLVIPTYISITNINNDLKLSYGVSIIDFESSKEAKEFEKKLKEEDFEPRILLLKEIDRDIKSLSNNYSKQRSKFLSTHKKDSKIKILASVGTIWDDIRVDKC